MAKNNTNNIIFLNPNEYFQGAVSGAVASLRVQVSEHAQHYLVQLLERFISMDNFYPTNGEGKPADTLTQQLAIALDEEKSTERAARLRKLGDFSLYVAGFFSDSLNRKLIDVDYYIGMGGAAYENAARLEAKKMRAEVLLELSHKFPKLVEVLGTISEESGFNPDNHKDLLRVYDMWVKTGEKKFESRLVKAGIAPVTTIEKKRKKTGSGDS